MGLKSENFPRCRFLRNKNNICTILNRAWIAHIQEKAKTRNVLSHYRPIFLEEVIKTIQHCCIGGVSKLYSLHLFLGIENKRKSPMASEILLSTNHTTRSTSAATGSKVREILFNPFNFPISPANGPSDLQANNFIFGSFRRCYQVEIS